MRQEEKTKKNFVCVACLIINNIVQQEGRVLIHFILHVRTGGEELDEELENEFPAKF